MKKKNAVALGLFLTMAMSMPASAIDASNVHRRDGSDRVKTSLESAKMVDSKVLVLASGYSYADSLSASNVVLKTGGKLVLVGEKTDVAALLKGNNYEKIYIVGGEKTLPKSVEESAKKLSKNVIRLSGANRYGTNEKTLSEFKINDVGVADGGNYPDALSASALLKDKNLGLLLVNGVKPYKTNHNVKYTFGYSVKQDAGKRLAGKDRYATNLAVLNEIGRKDNIAIASGEKFPDALSAINVVTAKDASVVLVRNNTNNISKDLNDYIEKAKDAYILGGTSTISKDVAKFLICENKTETPSYSGGGGGGGSHSYRPAEKTPEEIAVENFDVNLDEALKKIKLGDGAATIDVNGNNHHKYVNILKPDTPVTEVTHKTGAMVQLDKLINDAYGEENAEYKLDSYQIVGTYKVKEDGKEVEKSFDKVEFSKFEKNKNELRTTILEDFTKALDVDLDAKNPDDTPKIPTLASLEGKTVTAKVVFKSADSKSTKTEEYAVTFLGGEEAIVNDFNSSLQEALNDANIPESVATYEYNRKERTATVEVNGKDTKVLSLEKTGLANSLEDLVKNHHLYSYKIEGMDDAKKLKGLSNTEIKTQVVSDFATALVNKLGKDSNINSGNMTVGDLLKAKQLSADVVLDLGNNKTSEPVKYTVKFVDNEKEYKSEVKKEFNEKVNKAISGIKAPDSVQVSPEFNNNTKVVNIVKPSTPVSEITGTNAMVQLENLVKEKNKGYTLKSYKIEGKDFTEVDLTGMNKADIKSKIVEDFAKAAGVTNGNPRLVDFDGKTINADVKLVDNLGNETTDKYSVSFKLTEKALQDNFDSQLAKAIDPENVKIPDTAGTYTYDKTKKTAEFTIKNADAKVIGSVEGLGLGKALYNLVQNDFLYSYKIDGMDAPRVLAGLSQADQKSAVVEDMAKVVLKKAVVGDSEEAANIKFGQLAEKFPNGLSADVVVKAGDKESNATYTIKFVDKTAKPEESKIPTYKVEDLSIQADGKTRAITINLNGLDGEKVKQIIVNGMVINRGTEVGTSEHKDGAFKYPTDMTTNKLDKTHLQILLNNLIKADDINITIVTDDKTYENIAK